MATSPASAASNPDQEYRGTGVDVKVWELGDVVRVCDTKANGHRAWVVVFDDANRYRGYQLDVMTGAGTCKTARASDLFGRHDLTEGAKIELGCDGVYLYARTSGSFKNDQNPRT